MAAKKTVNVKDFYSESLEEYVSNLQKVKEDAGAPLILKPNVSADDAIFAVEKIVNGNEADGLNKNLIKLIKKKGAKPTANKVYQNVLVTFFKTLSAEYAYSYEYNGNAVNMSPKKIAINEGYAEFASATECFTKAADGYFGYNWEGVTDDMLTETIEPGYVIANVNKKDFEKDRKESMKQYNKKLDSWLKDFQQEKLGKARTLYSVTVYDKEYDYNEVVLLAPYILVTYDLGNSLITFSVNGLTGKVQNVLLNNPAARFVCDTDALPPSFSILFFLIFSVVFIIVGSIGYILWYFMKKLTYNKKSLNGYTVGELKKLL